MKRVYSVHPEVLPSVYWVFRRLHEKHPQLDGSALWKLAQEVTFAELLADTALFRLQIGLDR